jgi:hypothetical protein
MTPDAPRTEAGKRLLDFWESQRGKSGRYTGGMLGDILAIEAEAAAPTPEIIDKFTDDQFTAYMKALGFDEQIEASLAELRASRAATPADSLDALRVIEAMENEGVVTWGDAGHRDRFLAGRFR